MRIITGHLKGRKIHVPENTQIRPTSDRTKESIFNIIENRKELKNATVLDLFGGTGNLGFEALSRGVESVTFVEIDPAAVTGITKTAEKFGVERRIRTIQADVNLYLAGKANAYDIVFADPPYDFVLIPELPAILLKNGWLKEDGWFVLEHDARHSFSDHSRCAFSKAYGRTIVSIFT